MKIGSGATPTGGEASYLVERTRFALVRSQNVFDRRFEKAGLAFISDEQAERLKGVVLEQGDLLLNITGDGITFSRSCAVPNDILPACVNQHVAIIRLDPAVADAGFILSYLTHPVVKSYIESFNAGGSRRAITKGHIGSFQIPLPPRYEQRAIGQILGALDDKIELNRRMNETLEAMARALFKSWFVDFDPVRAKAEGREPGLPKPITDLFPAGLVDSELGEIPEGWPVSDLASVSSYLNRGLSPSYIDREGVLVLNQKCVRDRRVDLNKGRRHDPIARSVEGRLLKKGDVLVNSTGVGTLGRVGQLLTVEEDMIVDSHLTVIRADERRLSWNYLGINFWSREEEIEALGEGSTGQTELSRTRLGNLPVLVPPRNIIGVFDSLSLPIRERCAVNEQQSHVLAAVRDALLPRLISGELRVKEAERVVAEAAA